MADKRRLKIKKSAFVRHYLRLISLGALCLLCNFNSFAQNLDSLADAVRSGTEEVKRDALLQIRNLKSADASRLAVPALGDNSEIVRATAAFSVIFLPKEEAAQILLPLLQDKSALVRRETAYALGKVADKASTNALLQILQKDKIPEVRNASIVALGETGDASAVDALTQILRQKPSEDAEFSRRAAARSIGQIAQIIQTSEAEVVTPAGFSSAQNEITKLKRINLTETFPVFRAAVAALIQALQNRKESPDAKREAAFALGAIGDKAAIPVLRASSNNADYYLAEISRQALSKIQNR
ncbi:MAG TPA: HEAT repeat domain-containing protein [Pyrinomonadaceae bacterium]|jgi:HEAT repeat protein